MKQAFIKLHISIILAGFTGVFGKLISLNEALLVWNRMLLTFVLFFFILVVSKKFKKVSIQDMLKIGGTGLLLGLHWIFFYGSIKASNVSIGVVCFSLTGLFTAILEPLMGHRRISVRELLFSLVALCGIILIFHFDTRHRTGILLGATSAFLAAIFTITNKKVGARHDASTMLLYEMLGGFLCISCILPFYLHYFPVQSILPTLADFVDLFILSFFCTIGLYLLQIQVLKTISAFTVNLSYNLEPVYSIILAMIFFNEAKELNFAFYAGLCLIILSVLLQMGSVLRMRRIPTPAAR